MTPTSIVSSFERQGLLHQHACQPVAIPFVARLLDPSAFVEIRHIHHEVLRLVPEPGIVRVDTDEFFAYHLSGEGCTLGIFVDDRLIAYAILGLPETPAYPYDHFGQDLGLPTADRFQLAQLIGVGVLPEWRGNQLHRWLSEWRLDLARAAGKRHAAAVASPRNPFSWRNLLAVGLRIKGFKLLPGNMLRYLLHTDLQASSPPDRTTAIAVPATDTATQQELFRQGYWGYAAVATHGTILRIWYARPRPP